MEVYCDLVPKASFNFLALAASGYYNGTIFHRNMRGFMLQGGDPTGTGKGGESVWGGHFADEFHSDLKHDKRGTVSMANNGPDTNGSQFFISYGPQPHLNNKYTVFAQIIDGIDILDALEKVPVVGKKSKPEQDIRIEEITIHANPLAT
eukprot:CAMPEP_0184972948 /NCGR_PEP_ID=MMETSP1098-20130426/4869_1 /TAXON_ID=89044 /ORGANISM="Spumella elongata, Strain CCAP 955/1" /LENGTH=148 /DNA_ID=CAMNT_0027495351 /DNA_START=112 /DNA_END=558 /DNA_ORIENTATION=+